MPQITPEQALQYAPDDSSLKAAKKLAPANQWQQLHLHQTDDQLAILWGEIRGSSLYQYYGQNNQIMTPKLQSF